MKPCLYACVPTGAPALPEKQSTTRSSVIENALNARDYSAVEEFNTQLVSRLISARHLLSDTLVDAAFDIEGIMQIEQWCTAAE